jgi:diguanylate cyclase (GGDEF)-like protein
MNALLIIVQLFVAIFCLNSFAQTSVLKSQSRLATLTQATEYPINEKILTLLTLSIEKPKKANTVLAKSLSELINLNIGEQYLVLLLKANLAQYNNQHKQVIILLGQAQLLQDKIAKKQLVSPLFANLYQALATSLAVTKNYKEAYQVKKVFIDDYKDYGDVQRDRIVKRLTKKHEIKHKIETNKLLDYQNKLKALRLNDVEKKHVIQQRNFILILCTIIVFILLFLRQLKVRQKLILLTKTDRLTGLINRAALFVRGLELIETSTQQQLALSVLLFNIDDFKRINHNFSHRMGDLVLTKVAQLVSETMRSRDVFARIGSNEFVAILPNTDIDKAKAIAVRVMEKVTQYNFSELGLDNNITFSMGVANNHDTKALFDDLLHAAGLAMYQARTQGPNQMVSYSTTVKAQLV